MIPTEEDCCGNGCANCILDVRIKKSNPDDNTAERRNVISNYCKFRLREKSPHKEESGEEVLELHFCYAAVTSSETADCTLNIPLGHHIMMRAPLATDDGTKYLLRPYSPFWVDVTKMEFKILVDLKPRGKMSAYISKLRVGDEVEFLGPIGGTYQPSDYGDAAAIFIITQGVAVAPTIRIVESVLDDEENLSRICHLVCCSDLKHVYFRERLQEFSRFWNYKADIFLTRQHCDSCADACTAQCESFQRALLYKESVLPRRLCVVDLKACCQRWDSSEKKIFIVCGTRSFQDSIVTSIRNLELTLKDENIFLL